MRPFGSRPGGSIPSGSISIAVYIPMITSMTFTAVYPTLRARAESVNIVSRAAIRIAYAAIASTGIQIHSIQQGAEASKPHNSRDSPPAPANSVHSRLWQALFVLDNPIIAITASEYSVYRPTGTSTGCGERHRRTSTPVETVSSRLAMQNARSKPPRASARFAGHQPDGSVGLPLHVPLNSG